MPNGSTLKPSTPTSFSLLPISAIQLFTVNFLLFSGSLILSRQCFRIYIIIALMRTVQYLVYNLESSSSSSPSWTTLIKLFTLYTQTYTVRKCNLPMFLNSNFISINLITTWITNAIFYLHNFCKLEITKWRKTTSFKRKINKQIHNSNFPVYSITFTVLINAIENILKICIHFSIWFKLFCILLFSIMLILPINFSYWYKCYRIKLHRIRLQFEIVLINKMKFEFIIRYKLNRIENSNYIPRNI